MERLEFYQMERTLVGRFFLQPDGTAKADFLTPSVIEALEIGVRPIKEMPAMFPKDGRKFFKACVEQFDNEYFWAEWKDRDENP